MKVFELSVTLVPTPETDASRRLRSSWGVSEGNMAAATRLADEHACDVSHVQDLCAKIREVLEKRAREGPFRGDVERLSALGQSLYQELIHPRVKEDLRRTQPEFVRLICDPELVACCWDLVHDGEDFWGCRYALGRVGVTSHTEAVTAAPVAQGPPLVIADPRGVLPGALAEGEQLADALAALSGTEFPEYGGAAYTVADVLARLPHHWAVFFHGHAEYDPLHPEQSGWVMRDRLLTSTDWLKLRGGPVPALVVANACRSGATSAWREKDVLYGPANAALIVGCRAYVGTYSIIHDSQATSLTVQLAEEVARGVPVGKALRSARVAVKDIQGRDDLVWAYFLLFGDPTAILRGEATPPRTACARCGSKLSEAIAPYRCQAKGCDAVLCEICHQEGSLYCPQHTDQRSMRPEPLRCAFDRTRLTGAAPRQCDELDCSKPLCSRCSPVAWCRDHAPVHVNQLARPLQAKAWRYLEGIEHKCATLQKSRRNVRCRDGETLLLNKTRRFRFENLPTGLALAPEVFAILGQILPAEAEIIVIGESPELWISAITSRRALLAGEVGPLTPDDPLLAALTQIANKAGAFGVAVFSPTGWQDAPTAFPPQIMAIEQVGEEDRYRALNAPCWTTTEFMELLDPETNDQQFKRALEAVNRRLHQLVSVGEYLSGRTLAREEGLSEAIVVAAFSHMAKDDHRLFVREIAQERGSCLIRSG